MYVHVLGNNRIFWIQRGFIWMEIVVLLILILHHVQWYFSYTVTGHKYIRTAIFMPGLKGPPGHLVIGSSVRPSVCLSARNSVLLTNKVQYLKFGWWHSNQTWTVSSSMGSSHLTDITCPWGGRGQNIGLRDFCHTCISTLLLPGAFYLLLSNTITCKCNETQNLYACCCCLSILIVCLFVFNFYFILIFELFNFL